MSTARLCTEWPMSVSLHFANQNHFLNFCRQVTDNKDFVKLAILHNHFFHFKQRLSSVIIQPCQEDEPDAVVVALR
jgi:hypothetical protein